MIFWIVFEFGLGHILEVTLGPLAILSFVLMLALCLLSCLVVATCCFLKYSLTLECSPRNVDLHKGKSDESLPLTAHAA